MYEEYHSRINIVNKAIIDYFDKRRYNITKSYFNTILISGKVLQTHIYIRHEISSKGYTVNFSNVVIDESLRRSGQFTGLVKAVISSGAADIIKIGEVLTPEMRDWCKKYAFITNDGHNYFKILNRR